MNWKFDNGKGLVWAGLIVGWIGNRVVAPLSDGLSWVALIIGTVIVLAGCYFWLKWKNRHWAFMFWGILAPIGLLGISLLKSKKTEVN